MTATTRAEADRASWVGFGALQPFGEALSVLVAEAGGTSGVIEGIRDIARSFIPKGGLIGEFFVTREAVRGLGVPHGGLSGPAEQTKALARGLKDRGGVAALTFKAVEQSQRLFGLAVAFEGSGEEDGPCEHAWLDGVRTAGVIGRNGWIALTEGDLGKRAPDDRSGVIEGGGLEEADARIVHPPGLKLDEARLHRVLGVGRVGVSGRYQAIQAGLVVAAQASGHAGLEEGDGVIRIDRDRFFVLAVGLIVLGDRRKKVAEGHAEVVVAGVGAYGLAQDGLGLGVVALGHRALRGLEDRGQRIGLRDDGSRGLPRRLFAVARGEQAGNARDEGEESMGSGAHHPSLYAIHWPWSG